MEVFGGYLEKKIMSSQVAIQAPAFFEQMNQLVVSNNPDAVRLNQFKIEAQKRSQSDDVEAYLARGMLARLEGNAIKLSPQIRPARRPIPRRSL
jgi:hypothetical protein